MAVRVIEPPAALVTLEEVKAFLRVSDNDADAILSALIVAAQAEFDGPSGWVGRCFGEQKLEWSSDSLHCEFQLPYPDLKSVTSIEYRTGSEWIPVPTDSYENDAAGVIRPVAGTWPSMSAARVLYVAGMESGDPRLQQVRTAIFFHVKIHFDDGDFSERMRKVIDSLLSTLRTFS
ncbi:head-tail connector protein [Rhizobium sp. Leaf383]|uniref:head-tail connector protein n=1 Tax=Rhizobium sp. Leaf383 TaxID=1736357 RepID=UPI000714A04C|nr:head-tail connector protein [Rhizobium sp. Leaf383]KQS86944.1 hypothetical protein ASG58_01470 [Rhizobium sp. Leaf383]